LTNKFKEEHMSRKITTTITMDRCGERCPHHMFIFPGESCCAHPDNVKVRGQQNIAKSNDSAWWEDGFPVHCRISNESERIPTKDTAMWGTYGKGGNEPLKWVKLVDCTTEHLEAILRTQPQVWNTNYEEFIKEILEDRT